MSATIAQCPNCGAYGEATKCDNCGGFRRKTPGGCTKTHAPVTRTRQVAKEMFIRAGVKPVHEKLLAVDLLVQRHNDDIAEFLAAELIKRIPYGQRLILPNDSTKLKKHLCALLKPWGDGGRCTAVADL